MKCNHIIGIGRNEGIDEDHPITCDDLGDITHKELFKRCPECGKSLNGYLEKRHKKNIKEHRKKTKTGGFLSRFLVRPILKADDTQLEALVERQLSKAIACERMKLTVQDAVDADVVEDAIRDYVSSNISLDGPMDDVIREYADNLDLDSIARDAIESECSIVDTINEAVQEMIDTETRYESIPDRITEMIGEQIADEFSDALDNAITTAIQEKIDDLPAPAPSVPNHHLQNFAFIMAQQARRNGNNTRSHNEVGRRWAKPYSPLQRI